MINYFYGSDTIVRWDKMRRQTDNEYVNTATVTMTLKTADGVDVSGAVDISLSYVADSNGRYQGVLPHDLVVTVGTTYYLEITAVAGSYTGLRRVVIIPQYRGES